MLAEEIITELFKLQDVKYRNFQSRLIPTVSSNNIIGVRTPQLHKFAKQLLKRGDVNDFLHTLPHKYFDENQLHAFIISEMKNFEACIDEVNKFLPFVDNWATCDQMSPKLFGKHKAKLLEYITQWINSSQTYTVRFAIGMLMAHFLDNDFDISFLKTVASIRTDEYYINMMIAWYFATALAKQYDAVLPFIEGQKLDKWTHNKTIQKAVESYRITDEEKAFLKKLKV